jgi:hypothetical protein
MNYITLVKQFWQLRREVPFSSVEADLYFYLLEISNSLQWKNPFQQSNALIAATPGVSEKTLIAARNRLKQHALIDFTPGVKRTPSTYRLLLLKSSISLNTLEILQGIREECDSESGSESGSECDSVSGTNPPDIIKHKLNKTKRKTANAVTGEREVDADLHLKETPPASTLGRRGKKERAVRPAPLSPPPLDSRWPELVAELDEEGKSTWERFVAWEKENPLPKVFSMAEPLLPAQLVSLTRKHSSGEITSILLDMQNRRTLQVDYESANLTVQSWLRNRKKRETTTS